MRIANSVRMLGAPTFTLGAALLSVMICGVVPSTSALAADPLAPGSSPMAIPAVPSPSAPAANAIPPAAPAQMIAGSSPMMMPPISSAPATPGQEITKNVTALENKISENAKGVIKNLDATADTMTLEDLNTARQTIARIDAIIDVEKRLAELEKIRNERTGASSKASTSLASAIPASALQPPPMAMRAAEMPEHEIVVKPVAPAIEISRIVGSEGLYSAVLRVNGELKNVKAGDQVSGKTTVRAITASAVVLDENGENHTLHVKNVDAIFSAMR